jgi:hypothetical protein
MLLMSGAFTMMRAYAASGQDTLYTGQSLSSGQELVSQDGWSAVIMQSDGNLVEYNYRVLRPVVLWASGTWGHPGTILLNQNDGNMVLIAPGNHPIWSTNTSGTHYTVLTIQNDANIVAYAQGHVAVWASGVTYIPAPPISK